MQRGIGLAKRVCRYRAQALRVASFSRQRAAEAPREDPNKPKVTALSLNPDPIAVRPENVLTPVHTGPNGEEIWEYYLQPPGHKPRTVAEFRKYRPRMAELDGEDFDKEPPEEPPIVEEITELDVQREGHIMDAMDGGGIAKVRETPMNFMTRPKYVDDGTKMLQYWFEKYYKRFLQGVICGAGVIGTGWYAALSSDLLNKEIVLRWINDRRPHSVALEEVAGTTDLIDLWWHSMGQSGLGIFVFAAIFAKVKGEWWEFQEIKKEDPKGSKARAIVPTLKRKSHLNLIHQVREIRKENRERKLESVWEIVDIPASVTNALDRKPMLLNLIPKTLRGQDFYDKNPRSLPPTIPYGGIQLQTRFDRHGRLIPAWQRERKWSMMLPSVGMFLIFPQVVDMLTAWGS